MNSTQIHLALSHFPVIGFILLTLVFWYALVKRNEDFIRLSLIFFILLGVISFVVFNTGSGAVETLKEIPGIEGERIDQHENSGEISFWLFSISAILAALLLAFGITIKNKQQIMILLASGIIFSAAALHSLYTAHLGGKIRHTELHSNP